MYVEGKIMWKKKIFSCLRYLCSLFLLLVLVSCTTNEAPVIEGWKQNNAKNSDYRIQKKDTVYSIAWAFDMDYRELVRLNNLKEPYNLSEGQTLRMSEGDSLSTHSAPNTLSEAQTIPQPSSPLPIAEPVDNQASTFESRPTMVSSSSAPKTMITKTAQKWLWPTKGPVVRGFSAISGGNKGVDIAGKLSQTIVATAAGKVVYTGASLPGYGNLIIIKHSENELSAYAFNKVIAVKEGQVIKAGQIIAQMGNNDNGQAILHFEIRKNGKPVNPIPYLSKK